MKAQLVTTKSVFKLKMVGVGFSMFCEKLQNVCSLVFILEQMDNIMDAIFGLVDPHNP